MYKYTTYLRTFTYKWDNLRVTSNILLLLLLLNIVLYNFFLVWHASGLTMWGPEADQTIINCFVHYRVGGDVIASGPHMWAPEVDQTIIN